MDAAVSRSELGMSRISILKLCLLLFVISAGIRVVVWQNNKVEMAGVQWGLTELYKNDAKYLATGEFRLFLAGPNPPSDATVLLHPPGYPIFIGINYLLWGENEAFVIVQILLNSLAPVLIFLIAMGLFDVRVAMISGVLTALAPQFAYHSSVMLPDELAVLPILAALYFFVRAIRDGKLSMAFLCGVSIGLSCWFRSNALILPLFFAAFSLFLLPKHVRIRFAVTLVASFVLMIAPITIRNYIVFDSFIPLSLGMGTTFVEGLGDYDVDGKLGMPSTDFGVMAMDAQLANRPDYNAGGLLHPDGVLRERRRLRTGLSVVADNPGWYLKSVLHRASTSFRMERVPAIAPERDEFETTPQPLYFLNRPLKFIQRCFVTATILPLFLLGLVLLIITREDRFKFAILAIVPLYYATVQSLIHTEYRYILPTSHILMVFCAVFLSFLTRKVRRVRVK